MTTVEERREVARRLRELDYSDLQESLICAYLDALGIEGYADWVGIAHRLADLIEPTDGFDLDTVQRVCFERMEGCDEPEWTLYAIIHDAIARYRRGESGPICDRDALLALADELEEDACWEVQTPGDASGAWRLKDACDRIREALGVES